MARSRLLLWLLLPTLCGRGAGESPQPLVRSLSPGARCGGFPSISRLTELSFRLVPYIPIIPSSANILISR